MHFSFFCGGNNMPTTDAQKRATRKYIENKLDEFKVRFPKGEKAVIKEHATERGESVNEFFIRAVRETMERDKKNKTG